MDLLILGEKCIGAKLFWYCTALKKSFLAGSLQHRLCLNLPNAGRNGRSKGLELFRIYLLLLPVLNVNARCNHVRQKVKQALVYSRKQTANFLPALLLERILVFFPSDFFPFPAKTFITQRK